VEEKNVIYEQFVAYSCHVCCTISTQLAKIQINKTIEHLTTLPCTGTVAVTQSVRAPAGSTATPRARRTLLVWFLSAVVAGRTVVTDQVERRGVCGTEPGERLTEVIGTADVTTGRPHHLK